MKKAREEVFTDGEDRKDVPNIAIIISDGQPAAPMNVKINGKSLRRVRPTEKRNELLSSYTLEEAARLKQKAHIITVGVTSGVKSDFMEKLATSKDDFIHVQDFHGLMQSVNDVIDLACKQAQDA